MNKKIIAGIGIVVILGAITFVSTNYINQNKTEQGNQEQSKDSNIISRSELKVGDYIDYTYDESDSYKLPGKDSGYKNTFTGDLVDQEISQESLKFRIYNIDEKTGRVDLISTKTTSQKVCFAGATGYNNGVYILNDIAEKLYSNSELGIKARSINISDLENKMTQTGKDAITNYISQSGGQYGEIKTYDIEHSFYPAIFEKENGSGINTINVKTDGINSSDSDSLQNNDYGQANTTGLTVKQNAYIISKDLKSSIDITVYDLLYANSNDFWIASRGVYNTSTDAQFGLFNTYGKSNTFLGVETFCRSTGTDERVAKDKQMRIMVSIDGNIDIEAHTGTAADMHIIKK